ncbi:MAG: putative secreted protein [Paracoccaceae bacterium]|jgi:predicted secreted protein
MMTITGAIVIYAMAWFMCLFVVLPLKIKSQSEHGDVVPGTPASAPEMPRLKRKFIQTTVAATVIWAAVVVIVVFEVVSLADLPFPQLPSAN